MGSRRKRLPVTLTDAEQSALLAQPNQRYPTGERNYVLMRLMLDTGVRLAEASALRWAHIDMVTGKVMVIEGKGTKDRTLWVSENLLKCLRDWRERQSATCGSIPAHPFTTLKGSVLQHRYIQEMIRRCSIKAGIAKRVSLHILRHTFATDLYRESSNIRLVQKALGHADLSTTMIYTHVYDKEVERALKALRSDACCSLLDR